MEINPVALNKYCRVLAQIHTSRKRVVLTRVDCGARKRITKILFSRDTINRTNETKVSNKRFHS